MRLLRLVTRSLALALLITGLGPVFVVGVPVAACFGCRGRWQSWIQSLWSRAQLAILGARVEVVGSPPEGAFLLVSNHISYVDILVLAAQLRCAFVSKAEIASWPLLGFLARQAGTIFVDRDRRRDVVRVGEELRATIESGRSVVLFPEGTSTSGESVAPFRSSLLEPAAALELPVSHATLHYETPPGEVPARLSVAWWGNMEFGSHYRSLLRLPGFHVRLVFGDDPVRSPDRKFLAAELQERVQALFLPMLGGDENSGEEVERCAPRAG